MTANIYETDQYWLKHPSMDEEDAEFKATCAIRMVRGYKLHPTSILDVGCGSGKIACMFAHEFDVPTVGLDISPGAIAHAKKTYEYDRLSFSLLPVEQYPSRASLGLMLSVFEHVEDYIGFLRKAHHKADYWVFNIPLKMNALNIIRAMEIHNRDHWGHLHYFSEKTALATLEYCGYQIIDSTLMATVLHSLKRKASIKSVFAALPRLLLMTFNKSIGVRVLGGATLVVLAKSSCDRL